MLMGDFSGGIQPGDEIGMGELTAGVLFVFYAEEHREVLHIRRLAAQERPSGIERNFRPLSGAEALQLTDEDRAGVDAAIFS